MNARVKIIPLALLSIIVLVSAMLPYAEAQSEIDTSKFDPGFYETITERIANSPLTNNAESEAQYHSVIIVTNHKEDVVSVLTDDFGAQKIFNPEHLTNVVTADVPVDLVPRLSANPDVIMLGDGELELEPLWTSFDPDNPNHVSILQAKELSNWSPDVAETGKNVRIGYIDLYNGPSHQDLPDSTVIERTECGFDFHTYSVVCTTIPPSFPQTNHFNHGASILAGSGESNSIMRGFAPDSKIMLVANGDIIQSLNYLVGRNTDVILIVVGQPTNSCSASGFNGFNTRSIVVDGVVDNHGISVIIANGNSRNDSITSTACSYNGISVGNIAADGSIDYGSSRGGIPGFINPLISAIGSNIAGAGAGTNYNIAGGTSFSTPVIASAAALLLEQNSNLSPNEIRTALLLGANFNHTGEVMGETITASDYEGTHDTLRSYVHKFGFGTLNVKNSLDLVTDGIFPHLISDNVPSISDNKKYRIYAHAGDGVKVLMSWDLITTIPDPDNNILNLLKNYQMEITKPDGSKILSNSTRQNTEFAYFTADTDGYYTIKITTDSTGFDRVGYALASNHPLDDYTFSHGLPAGLLAPACGINEICELGVISPITDDFDDLDDWEFANTISSSDPASFNDYVASIDTQSGNPAPSALISGDGYKSTSSLARSFPVNILYSDDLFLGFDYGTVSNATDLEDTSIILNITDQHGNTLYSEYIGHNGTADSRWQSFEKDISNIVYDYDLITVMMTLTDWSSENQYHGVYFDNFYLRATPDTTTPTISGMPTLHESTGVLSISFDEPIDAHTINPTGFHIRDDDTNSTSIILSDRELGATDDETIRFILAESSRQAVIAMSTPTLDVGADAVFDLRHNGIAAVTGLTLNVTRDTVPPTIKGTPTLDVADRTLNVAFTEYVAIATINPAGFHIRNSTNTTDIVSLSYDELITASDGETILFRLDQASYDEVVELTAPVLYIEADAVDDISGNGIASTTSQQLSIGDFTPPALSESEKPSFDTRLRTLTITFNEGVVGNNAVDASKFHVQELNDPSTRVTINPNEWAAAALFTSPTTIVKFVLQSANFGAINAMNAPTLYIDAGAVRDPAGNGIEPVIGEQISIIDTASPQVLHGTLDKDTGVLRITFNEPIDVSAINKSEFYISTYRSYSGGFFMDSDDRLDTETDSSTIQFTLGESHRTRILAINDPWIQIDQSAVRDIAGNRLHTDTDLRLDVVDTTPPTISGNPTLDEETRVLNITFNEPVDISTINATKFHIRESDFDSGGVTLSASELDTTSDGSTVRFTLAESKIQTIIALETPTLDVDSDAIRDVSGNGIVLVRDHELNVTDVTGPVLTVPDDKTFEATAIMTQLTLEQLGTATATDNIDPNPTVSSNATDTFPLGTTTILYTATDIANNTSTATQIITIRDTTPPVFDSVPEDIVRLVESVPVSINYTIPTASDIFPVTVQCNPALGSSFDVGTTEVICTATDESSNAATISFDITVYISDPTSLSVIGTPTLNLATGVLSMTFDEPVDTSTVSLDHIRILYPADLSEELKLLSSRLTTTQDGTTIQLAIPESTRPHLLAIEEPVLHIYKGSIRGTGGNEIKPTGTMPLDIMPDTVPPSIISSSLDAPTGILSITFDEFIDISTIQASKFRVQQSGDPMDSVSPFEDEMITVSDNTIVQFRFADISRFAISEMETPVIAVDAGAIRDLSGNGIEPAGGLSMDVRDQAPVMLGIPTLDENTGVMSITFDQPIDVSTVDMPKFRIHGDAESYVGDDASFPLGERYVTAEFYATTLNLTFEEQPRNRVIGSILAPMLYIEAGGVSDTSGSGIREVESLRLYVTSDTTPPSVHGTPSLNTETGEFVITFDQFVYAYGIDASGFHIRDSDSEAGGITLSDGERAVADDSLSAKFVLTESHRDAVLAMNAPVLDIDEGAISDPTYNGIVPVSGLRLNTP